MTFDSEYSVFKGEENSQIERIGIRWGGIAGDGLQATGILLSKFLNKIGFFSFGFPGTQSTIRGGHIWFHTEFSNTEFSFFDRTCDVLIAFNSQSLVVHLRDLKKKGILIINSDTDTIDDYKESIDSKEIIVLTIPLNTLVKEIDPKLMILKNTIVVGTLIELLNLNHEPYIDVLKKNFSNKENVIDANIRALNSGRSYVSSNYHSIQQTIKIKESKFPKNERIIVSGNEAVAVGAVASGLGFLAQYPITPASSILKYISQNAKKFGIIVKQTEDEIAAIISISAASWTGVRAMTATSGPGFSLMIEGLGYAGMTETPIVIVLSQRSGPSTGIPTKMEQADLMTVLHAGHGEFLRCIIAPRSVEECFSSAVKAFNIADKYQIPVILMIDFTLSEYISSIKPFNLKVPIERGKIWSEPTQEDPEFKRFKLTENGVSPRAFPGTEGALHVLVGAEHDEESHSLSGNRCGLPLSGVIHEKMIDKRFRKVPYLSDEMDPPKWTGNADADFTLICWGSLEGACQEAIIRLNDGTKKSWNVLSFKDIYPLPVNKIIPELQKIKTGIMIEVNHTSQFEQLLFTHTNWRPFDNIHLMSGETPTAHEIIPRCLSIMNLSTPNNLKENNKEIYPEAWF